MEIVQVAYCFCKDYKNLNFIHIRAHTGLQDIHSIGNDNADRLANEAIGINYNKMSKGKKKRRIISLSTITFIFILILKKITILSTLYNVVLYGR